MANTAAPSTTSATGNSDTISTPISVHSASGDLPQSAGYDPSIIGTSDPAPQSDLPDESGSQQSDALYSTQSKTRHCTDFLSSAKLVNGATTLATLVALLTFVLWFLAQRYTVKSSTLQSCISLASIDRSSLECNETIARGVPSLFDWKRDLGTSEAYEPWARQEVIRWCLVAGLTLAAAPIASIVLRRYIRGTCVRPLKFRQEIRVPLWATLVRRHRDKLSDGGSSDVESDSESDVDREMQKDTIVVDFRKVTRNWTWKQSTGQLQDIVVIAEVAD